MLNHIWKKWLESEERNVGLVEARHNRDVFLADSRGSPEEAPKPPLELEARATADVEMAPTDDDRDREYAEDYLDGRGNTGRAIDTVIDNLAWLRFKGKITTHPHTETRTVSIYYILRPRDKSQVSLEGADEETLSKANTSPIRCNAAAEAAAFIVCDGLDEFQCTHIGTASEDKAKEHEVSEEFARKRAALLGTRDLDTPRRTPRPPPDAAEFVNTEEAEAYFRDVWKRWKELGRGPIIDKTKEQVLPIEIAAQKARRARAAEARRSVTPEQPSGWDGGHGWSM